MSNHNVSRKFLTYGVLIVLLFVFIFQRLWSRDLSQVVQVPQVIKQPISFRLSHNNGICAVPLEDVWPSDDFLKEARNNPRLLEKVSPVAERVPFVGSDGTLCLIEGWRDGMWTHSNSPPRMSLEQVWVRTINQSDPTYVYAPFANQIRGLPSVVIDGAKVYIYASNGDTISYITSDRNMKIEVPTLFSWDVVNAGQDEKLFNSSITQGSDGVWYMVVETNRRGGNDHHWIPNSFVFYHASTLDSLWTEMGYLSGPNKYLYTYGTDRFVGTPALYAVGEYYYLLYSERDTTGSVPTYSTWITRSQNLREWEIPRPFITFNPTQPLHPLLSKSARNASGGYTTNASNVKLCEVFRNNKVQTYICWTAGNKQEVGFAMSGWYVGNMKGLFEEVWSGLPEKQNPVLVVNQ